MKKLPLIAIPVLLCTLSTKAQHRLDIKPPESMNEDNKTTPAQVTLPRRLDVGQLQKEADDLARTAQTIPSDMESVRRGILPKDVVQKLKQIEKLSKHLRSELNP